METLNQKKKKEKKLNMALKIKLTLNNEPVATNDGTLSGPLSLKNSAGEGGYWICKMKERRKEGMKENRR